jgi:heme-degrading monooxygenase HmoA
MYPILVVSNRIATLGAARDTSLNFWFRRNCQHPRAGDGTTLFVTLWEFEVKRGSEELFERTYGPEGEWARLFQPDGRYRGTRLLRDVGATRVYVTMDSWESRAAYEEFREKFAAEYGELDRECEGLTVSEKHLGH